MMENIEIIFYEFFCKETFFFFLFLAVFTAFKRCRVNPKYSAFLFVEERRAPKLNVTNGHEVL